MLDPEALIDPLKPKRKRKPLGPAIEWDDAVIDDMSTVRPADLAHAAALWHNEVAGPLQTLLDAQPEQTVSGYLIGGEE